MKRKKWSELEEQTLLTMYSDLLNSGTLAKLKTREKKFKPIAEHVNSVHNLQDPITFPFKWSWRDVSIKVQNMRHQYLGVKQKIRVPNGDFNWKDGENHWENFLKYKEVFGDVELELKAGKKFGSSSGFLDLQDGDDVLELGFDIDSEDLEEDDNLGEDLVASDGEFCGEKEEIDDLDSLAMKRLKNDGSRDFGRAKKLGLLGAQVLELREVMLRREERSRDREWNREERLVTREETKRKRESELEERQTMWVKRDLERRLGLEKEFDEEKRRRMRVEERWEEEEMQWRERLVSLQIEHEKRMMQMHSDACQNQMQVIGVIARLVCQFFGSASDNMGGGLGALPPPSFAEFAASWGFGCRQKV